MKLKKAIEIYKKEKGAPGNAYDWYRRSAKERGKVYIGKKHIDAFNIGNQWHVDDGALKGAVKSHQNHMMLRKKNTEDFSKGIYHGEIDQVIEMEWGGYKNYEGFIYAWSDYLRARKESDGNWYCRLCGSKAKQEYNKKCFINNDYHICRAECTLSKIYCLNCGTKIDF
ncbi:hypothetical protein LCGC14_2720560 [marine sediment metagenome]|uniref:Uncharacterized protein n=1 Tax=marine sediment metagenome TaxID=412755 RepID=A0A0F8ZA44_9ZZZZ